MRTRGRVLGSVLALLLTAGAAPGLAASRGGGSNAATIAVARYSFDSAQDGVADIRGSVRPGPGAVFVLVSVDMTQPRHPLPLFADVLDLSSPQSLRTYGDAGNRELCPAPLTCHMQNGRFDFGFTDIVNTDGHHRARLRAYVAVRGRNARIDDAILVNWTARHRRHGLVTRTDRDAAGAGVDAAGTDVGALAAVVAPGPRGGSVAVAVPGCDAAGAGVATFSGGGQRSTLMCPSGPVPAYAARATSWRLSGAIAGVSQNQTRLVILAA